MADQTNALAAYRAEDETDVSITMDLVREICPEATELDAKAYAIACLTHRVNPYSRQIYLVKTSRSQPAAVVVGIHALEKLAHRNADYRGIGHGIVVVGKDGAIQKKRGTALYPGEKLVGGWAEVHREGMDPFYEEVSYSEYCQTYKDRASGEVRPRSTWAQYPATMIDKVARSHAYRSAYPDELGGLYEPSEIGPDIAAVEAGEEEPIAVEPVAIETAREAPTEAERVELASIAEAVGDKRAVWAAFKDGGIASARSLVPAQSADEYADEGIDF